MILGVWEGGESEDFPIFGTGEWIVTGGTMTVEKRPIEASGNWTVSHSCSEIDGIDHSLLEFKSDVDIDCLSGDLTVDGGKVRIDTDFQTSGKLTFRSPKNAVQPEIFIAEGKTAVFSEVCP